MTDLPPGLHGAHLRAALVAELGLAAVRALRRSGRLGRYSRFVLVDRERLPGLRTRAAAALLTAGPGAVLTSHTAAALFGCTAADTGAVHVLTGYHRQVRCRDDLVMHHGPVGEADVVELDRLRVLALEAVITELLCTAGRATALACCDEALAGLDPGCRGLFTAEVSRRLGARGDNRGLRRARTLLGLATGRTGSPAASRLLLLLHDARLPRPEVGQAVGDHRLDFTWPTLRVALTCGVPDFAAAGELRRRGWLLIRAGPGIWRTPTGS